MCFTNLTGVARHSHLSACIRHCSWILTDVFFPPSTFSSYLMHERIDQYSVEHLKWIGDRGILVDLGSFASGQLFLFYYSSFLGLTRLSAAYSQFWKCTGLYLGNPALFHSLEIFWKQWFMSIFRGITISHYLTSSVLKPLLHIFCLVYVCLLFVLFGGEESSSCCLTL